MGKITIRQPQVVAMRPLIVHASSKANSVAHRRVLHIEYATQPKLLDGLELAASIKLVNNLG
jgi:hypothetical protein